MRNFFSSAFIMMIFISHIFAQEKTIRGIVRDENGQPVANVSIHVLNTNTTVISGKDGSFRLPNQIAGTHTLSFETAGFAYLQKEITGNDENLQVELHSSINQLDAVIVTANKREDNQQLLPLAVSSLTSKQVEDNRLWNTNGLTAIVPDLYSDNPGDGRNITSIRGIVTTSYDPAVATYIDGVNQFSLDTYLPTLTDIERIEVLRGPQGTLYGRNAMGGVVNIITKQPTNKTEAFAEVSAGNYHLQRYHAGFRVPLVKNKLFAGASFLYNRRNGYYRNDYTDESYDKQHQFYGNYYLTYLPAEKWKITLNAKHQENRNNGAFPLVFGADEAFGNPFHVDQNATAKMIDNTFNSSLLINHSNQNFNLDFISTYQSNYRIYNAPLDGDFSPYDVVSVINDYGKPYNKVKVFTQEVRLSSGNEKQKLQYTAGAYFFYQDNPVKQGTYYGELANAVYGVGDSLFTILNTSKSKGAGVAVYGQLQYAVTNKLRITGGLRYDYEHRRLTAGSSYQKEDFNFPLVADSTAAAGFDALSPKVSAQYLFSGQSNVYASYTRGYRTGGLSPIPSDPTGPVSLSSYSPENSNNYEAGSKNTFFNNKLRVNLAAFITLINNAQVPTLVLPQAITLIRNTGKLEAKGLEAEVSATPLKGLQIDYNAGITRAKYTSLKVSQNGAEVNLDGKRQIYTPSGTSSLAVQYNLHLTKNLGLMARGEWQYRGNMYFDFANTIEQHSYHLLNAKAGVSFKNFGLYGWARNILNKRYIAYAYDFGAIHLGDPKTFGLTLSARF